MNDTTTIRDDAKAHFWTVVRECLIEFHGTPRSASRAKVLQFRRKVEAYPKDALELFYHNEPFDVACRIAKRRISVDKHIKRYIEIRDVEHPLASGDVNSARRPA